MNSLLNYMHGSCWAIEPDKLSAIRAFVEMRLRGDKADVSQIEAAAAQRRQPLRQVRGATAVLPMFGTLIQRAGPIEQMSGAVDPSTFGREFDDLVADDSVGAIVLHIDSPGGVIYGIPELSAKIFAARGKKRIIAVADGLMASAAYWVGTAADEVVASPSSDVGSIGVYLMHMDYSENLQAEGIKTTIIKAGKYKAEGNPYESLTEEAATHYQASVDSAYRDFLGAVAQHRGTTVDDVKKNYGEGRVLSARDALAAGMVDRIATIEDVVNSLTGGKTASNNTRRKRVQLLAS